MRDPPPPERTLLAEWLLTPDWSDIDLEELQFDGSISQYLALLRMVYISKNV